MEVDGDGCVIDPRAEGRTETPLSLLMERFNGRIMGWSNGRIMEWFGGTDASIGLKNAAGDMKNGLPNK